LKIAEGWKKRSSYFAEKSLDCNVKSLDHYISLNIIRSSEKSLGVAPVAAAVTGLPDLRFAKGQTLVQKGVKF